MTRQTYAIGILSLTAVVLFVAQFIPIQPATAAESVNGRDYSLATARVQQSGDALYVVDNRAQLIAAFTWDSAARTIKVRDVKPVASAFE
jgi:hypothetical protein